MTDHRPVGTQSKADTAAAMDRHKPTTVIPVKGAGPSNMFIKGAAAAAKKLTGC